ncbi:MAG: polysaccharide deacetylase family protein [Phormidesmis sp.]
MKKIALTFDDGPYGKHKDKDAGGNYTNAALQIFRNFNAQLRAIGQPPIVVTFYMQAAYITKNPSTFNQVIQDGHEIANHAWIHDGWIPNKNVFMVSENQAFREFQKAHNEFAKYRVETTLFRPLCGRITESLWAQIQQQYPQYRLAGWDYHPEKDSPAAFDIDFANRGPRDAAVYLLHEKKEGTLPKDFIGNRSLE